MKRDAIDFHLVLDQHLGIHSRLLNWAKWADGKPGASVSPMFRLYITPARGRSGDGVTWGVPVDRKDAVAVAKAVAALPESNRAAVNWCYIKPVNPRRAATEIGTTLDGLLSLLRDGRQMLINRGA